MELFSDEYFMAKAIEEAKIAYDNDEVPIGAVIVCNNKVIGRGYNQTEKLTDVTAHAEMLAITSAANSLNSKYLDECTLYVTVEPCVMCAGAIHWARLKKIVWGATEPKSGFSSKLKSFTTKTELEFGILEQECAQLMKEFFKNKR